MPQPRMLIIAGPPGAGKSSIFDISGFAENFFNADDRAAKLNRGSYQAISLEVRAVVNREFEQFVDSNISARNSFALETTRRSTITFEQAKLARQNGFRVSMRYVALDTVERHIERVKRRAAVGGHSASETTLRRIHASSLRNLPVALDPEASGVESVRIFDNSRPENRPSLVLASRRGRIVRIAESFPEWLQTAFRWTPQEVEKRRELARRPGL